jgi:hypothetical protein
MTITLSKLIHFSNFYNEVKATKIPVKTAYKLNKLAIAIDEQNRFYSERLNLILGDCADRGKDGNYIPTNDGVGVKVLEDKQQEFVDRVNELLLLEVELPDIAFDIEEFGNVELTMESFNLITPFLKD